MTFPDIEPGFFVLLPEKIEREDWADLQWNPKHDEFLGKWVEIAVANNRSKRYKSKEGILLFPIMIKNIAKTKEEIEKIEKIDVGDFVVLKDPSPFECLRSQAGQSKLGIVMRLPESDTSFSFYQVAAFGTGEISEYYRKELIKIEPFEIYQSFPFEKGKELFLNKPFKHGHEALDPRKFGAGTVHLATSPRMICLKFEDIPNRLFCFPIFVLISVPPPFAKNARVEEQS